MENVVFGALAIPYRVREGNVEFLLLKHKSGIWTFPGGAKDDEDRTLEDCLVREIMEEIGLSVEKQQLIPTGLINRFKYGPEKPARNGMMGETHFWLLNLEGGEELGSWDNIVDHSWFSKEKVFELLPFEDERTIFLQAVGMIRL